MNEAAAQIRTERVTWAQLARRAPAWTALAQAAATHNVFSDPAFAIPAADALGVSGALEALLAWDGDRLVGMMAFRRLSRWGVPFPVVEAWTHPYAPSSLPLVAADCAEAATIALIDTVTADPGLPGIVMLPLLALDTPFAAALLSVRKPLYIHGGHQRAVAKADLGGDAYLERTLSAGRRKKLRQQRNAFAREGELRFEMKADAGEVAAALETFLALEASGWKGDAGTALGSDGASETLARRAVSGLAARGMVRIMVLTCGERPVAALIAFVSGDTAWLWKIAYDEAFARHSPGKHVLMETVRALLDETPGLTIDSCATPDHPLADMILGERMAMGDVIVSAGGRAGPAFRTANMLERLRGRLRDAVRRLRG